MAIASDAGIVGTNNFATYTASKFAVVDTVLHVDGGLGAGYYEASE